MSLQRDESPYAPVDPFDGYFTPDRAGERPHGVSDVAEAQWWFDYLRWGFGQDLYTYQQPIEQRSGATVSVGGREMLGVSSYDYLGLIGHSAITGAARTAIDKHGTGTGGVRLLTGTHMLHKHLEDDIARFKRTQCALTFTSGYLANIAAITGLVGPKDRVFLDDRAHRSLIDGCRLARVRVTRFAHNDMQSLQKALDAHASEKRRTLIISEGIFSMDGDICALPQLVALKSQFGAYLLVDEAHSFGVSGASCRGVDDHFGLMPSAVDVWTGSLSKAIPSNGGFVAGSKALIYYLQHVTAPFVFSAALCPASSAAASAALSVIEHEPTRAARAQCNAERLREYLSELGFDTGASQSCVIPVILGETEVTYRAARELYSMGILVSAIVPPAVPAGGARIRLCVTYAHSDTDLDIVGHAFERLRRDPDVERACA